MSSDLSEFHRDRAAHIAVPYPPDRLAREAGRVRLGPTMPLGRSYLSQRVRCEVDGAAVDMAPTTTAQHGRTPFAGAVHVLSAWSPAGRLETLARNVAAGQRLREHLRAMDIEHRPAAAYAPDRSWAEGCVVVEGMGDEGAVGLGRLLRQPAVTRFDDAGVHVLPTGLVDLAPAGVAGWAMQPAKTTCPMRRDGAPGERCRNPGGPYVSRSMEVGLIWNLHRELLTGLLGCSVCGDGAGSSLGVGRPVALGEPYVANRYGGWQFADSRPE